MSSPPAFPPAPRLEHPLGPGWRPRVAAWLLALGGWRVMLAQPVPMRCVVVFYPHTSNWDFPVGLLAKWMIGIHFRFIAKDSLFAGPWGALLRRWGGIAVNRRERTGFIAQLAQRFAEEADFRLVIAPEGTRSRTAHWKSGFYHLARAAGVPVALAFIDYARREVGVGACVTLTGDAGADMARIAAFYAGKRGKARANQGPVRLADTVDP